MKPLLEEYAARVYRFALRLTGDRHLAEDLTQETFLRAWRARRRLREPDATGAWLLWIAANLWRDEIRRSHRRPNRVDLAPNDQTAAFEAHLNDCAACREEVQRQRRIDRLLREGTSQLEPIPSSLIDRIEGQIGAMRRRRAVRAACATGCAVALLLAAGLWLTTPVDSPVGSPSELAVETRPSPTANDEQPDVQEQLPAEAQPSTEIAMVDSSTAIVVPLETSNPNVSIVWLYPTVKPRPTEPVGQIP